MFFFINRRLVRDKIILHAISEAYRNILPSGTFPVVIMFVTIPYEDVDVNVHPAKTEVRFKHQSFVHDAIRDSILAGLTQDKTIVPMKNDGSPISPFAAPELEPRIPDSWASGDPIARASFALAPGMREAAPEPIALGLNFNASQVTAQVCGENLEVPAYPEFDRVKSEVRPLGQLRDSFIIATDSSGLIVIDQHVAHERVLFEKILRERDPDRGAHEGQRLLMPLIVELTPGQQAVFTEISEELRRNGFEVELFGAKTVAVKTAPAGIEATQIERMLVELLDQFQQEEQALNLLKIRMRIAASVACHAAIKINTPLEQNKMEWLLKELSATECPMSCPHGRPVVLRYSVKEIQRAFKRI